MSIQQLRLNKKKVSAIFVGIEGFFFFLIFNVYCRTSQKHLTQNGEMKITSSLSFLRGLKYMINIFEFITGMRQGTLILVDPLRH